MRQNGLADALEPQDQMSGQDAHHLSRKTMSLLTSACARARDCEGTHLIKASISLLCQCHGSNESCPLTLSTLAGIVVGLHT